MFIGAHVSIAKGLYSAAKSSLNMGGNTFQFFTRNPRGGKAKVLDIDDIQKATALMQENEFGPLVAHAPYTYNLASLKADVREFSIRTLKEDFKRIETLGVPYLVLHVGSHGGQGEEEGFALVKKGLEEVLVDIPDGKYLLLEVMAGAGTELGYTFSQMARIIESCQWHPQLGLCLDTCHMTGAGYDLTHWDKVKNEIEKEVGLERVKALHLNDSKHPVGARKDRHAKLGEGYLGLDVIKALLKDDIFATMPIILETPNDDKGYAEEIILVKEMLA